MAFLFEVKGKQIEFDITEIGIIRGYEFRNSVPDSKYAKGYQDERMLIIKGSISRTLEKAPDVLDKIRKWAKIEYKNRDTYYNYARITHYHRDEIIRYVLFPDAFVSNYREEIDPHTGDGIYTLTLRQKLDRRIDIEVGPFNEKHPRLSELMRERKPREVPADYVAAVANSPQNSPYWVERHRLVSDRVRLLQSRVLHLNPGQNPTSVMVPQGAGGEEGLRVLRARITNDGQTWYQVEYDRRFGWIGDDKRTFEPDYALVVVQVLDRPQNIVMVANPNANDDSSIAQVWGRGTPEVTGQILVDRCVQRRYDFAAVTVRDSGFDGTVSTRAVGGNVRGLVDGTVVTVRLPHNHEPSNLRWREVTRWDASAAVSSRVTTATFTSQRMRIEGNEFIVKHYQVDPRDIAIEQSGGHANDWRANGIHATNASFLANRNLMTAFHMFDGSSAHTGGENNFEELDPVSQPMSAMYLLQGETMPVLHLDPVYGLPDSHFVVQDRSRSALNLQRSDIRWLLGGFSLFLRDNTINSNSALFNRLIENHPTSQWVNGNAASRRPRTFIGFLSSGIVILGTVFDEIVSVSNHINRTNNQGPNLFETRAIARRLGCVEALMLDGGGTSQLTYSEDGVNKATVVRVGTSDYIRHPGCRIRIASDRITFNVRHNAPTQNIIDGKTLLDLQ